MRLNLPNSHVYVATNGEAVKVGATYNVENRAVAIRRHNGLRFDLVKAWPHNDPYAIEMMVLHSLCRMGFERLHKEVFVASSLTAKREVTKAMRYYEKCKFTHGDSAKYIGDLWFRTRFPDRWRREVIGY